jgi:hypothetical protein
MHKIYAISRVIAQRLCQELQSYLIHILLHESQHRLTKQTIVNPKAPSLPPHSSLYFNPLPSRYNHPRTHLHTHSLNHGILHHLRHPRYHPSPSKTPKPKPTPAKRRKQANPPVRSEFTSQLEGYEGVTAQCHNCTNSSPHIPVCETVQAYWETVRRIANGKRLLHHRWELVRDMYNPMALFHSVFSRTYTSLSYPPSISSTATDRN